MNLVFGRRAPYHYAIYLAGGGRRVRVVFASSNKNTLLHSPAEN